MSSASIQNMTQPREPNGRVASSGLPLSKCPYTYVTFYTQQFPVSGAVLSNTAQRAIATAWLRLRLSCRRPIGIVHTDLQAATSAAVSPATSRPKTNATFWPELPIYSLHWRWSTIWDTLLNTCCASSPAAMESKSWHKKISNGSRPSKFKLYRQAC